MRKSDDQNRILATAAATTTAAAVMAAAAAATDGASRRQLGAGLRGVVSGTLSPNLVINSMPLRLVV